MNRHRRHLSTRRLVTVLAVSVATFAASCTPSANSAETQAVQSTYLAQTGHQASQTGCNDGVSKTINPNLMPPTQPYRGEQMWNGECTANGTTYFVTSVYVYFDTAMTDLAYAQVHTADMTSGVRYGSYDFSHTSNTWTLTGKRCPGQPAC